MALTNNNINLIRALSEGDTHKAKQFALLSLKEDKTKKNEWATNSLTKKLFASGLSIGEAIPADINRALVGWSVHEFDSAKYYLRDTEKKLADKIRIMSLMSGKLSEMGVEYANTCLLYGETGTGKTEFARYFANLMGMPLFYVNFSQAIDSYMRNTAKNINKIISFAAQWPCILLLDEIDCIAVKRKEGSEGPNAELARTTVSVMQALDTLPSSVILLACTNKPGMLDDALLRRFSIKHEFKAMTHEDLIQLAEQYVKTTGTEKYISADRIKMLTSFHQTPGELMPELIREIGDAYYKEHAEELEEEASEEAKTEYTDLWDVTGTYTARVEAETEADAIAAAKKLQNGYIYSNSGKTEWKADRIEERGDSGCI